MKHLLISDTQVKKGVPLDHIRALGNFIVDKKPDRIIMIGDFADMPSLSSYDKPGTKAFEGKRYSDDIESSIEAMELLFRPINAYNDMRQRNKKKAYKPDLHLTLGNHEDRITRAVNLDPRLDGTLSIADLRYQDFGWTVHPFLNIVDLDGVAYCLEENHKVLTSGLRYVALKDIKEGDELLAFDEFPDKSKRRARNYKLSTVLKHGFDTRELYEVTLSNGKKFRCTKDHQWLAKKYPSGTNLNWLRTDELVIGKSIPVQVGEEWSEDTSYEAGYLAGMFDGEGHIHNLAGQGGIQVAVSQRNNKALKKVKEGLEKLEFKYSESEGRGTNKDVHCLYIRGHACEKLRLLGTVRADRLIDNFDGNALGRLQSYDNGEKAYVASIEPVGEGRIVKIKTSTGTMIAEGYAHHNCHYFINPDSAIGSPLGGTIENKMKLIGHSFTMGHNQKRQYGIRYNGRGQEIHGLVSGAYYMHDEDYQNPQGNRAHWRGIVLKNEVKDGAYDPVFLSLDYMLRAYL